MLGKYGIRCLILSIALTKISLLACPARAADPADRKLASRIESQTDLVPTWSRVSELYETSNHFYLADQVRGTRGEGHELHDQLFSSTVMDRVTPEYWAVVRQYEFRKNYSLASPDEDRAYMVKMSEMTKSILSQLKQYQVNQNAVKLRAAANRIPVLQAIRKPIELVAVVAAVYSGQPMNFHLCENLNLVARTEVPNQKANIAVSSSIVQGEMSFIGGDSSAKNPDGTPAADSTHRQERYRVAVSRSLPIAQVNAAVAYGSTTNSITTSLSKEVVSHLTVAVASVHSLAHLDPALGLDEDRVQFIYGMRF